jgi:hypothetical protein
MKRAQKKKAEFRCDAIKLKEQLQTKVRAMREGLTPEEEVKAARERIENDSVFGHFWKKASTKKKRRVS